MCHRPEPAQERCQRCGPSPPLPTHGNRNTHTTSPLGSGAGWLLTGRRFPPSPAPRCHSRPFGPSCDRDTPPRRTQTDRPGAAGCRRTSQCHVCQGRTLLGSPPICPAAPHVSPASGGAARDDPPATLPPVSTAREERGISTK